MPSATAPVETTKQGFYAVLIVSSIVVLLCVFGARLPSWAHDLASYLLFPGVFVAVVMINGSLHDRVIPGLLFLSILFDCILYSALALIGIWLVGKLRKSS